MASEASFDCHRTEKLGFGYERDVITGLLFLLVSLSAWPRLRRTGDLADMKARVNQVPVEERVRICAGIARRAVEQAKDRYAWESTKRVTLAARR